MSRNFLCRPHLEGTLEEDACHCAGGVTLVTAMLTVQPARQPAAPNFVRTSEVRKAKFAGIAGN